VLNEPYTPEGSDLRRPSIIIGLVTGGRKFTIPVAKLSGMALLPDDVFLTSDKPYLDHLDRDITNSASSNLEAVDHTENVLRSCRENPNRGKCAPKQSKPVQYNIRGLRTVHRMESAREASRLLGISGSSISAACNDRSKTVTDSQRRTLEFDYCPRPPSLPSEVWITCTPVEGFTVEVSSLGRYVSPRGIFYTPTPAFGKHYATVWIGNHQFPSMYFVLWNIWASQMERKQR
jgi:hypothetical protein